MGTEDLALMEDFLAESKFKSTTASMYRIAISQYLQWCDDNAIGLFEARASDVVAWMAARRECGNKEATVAGKFSAVKSFYSWMVSRHLLPKSPLDRLAPQRIEPGMPTAIGLNELRNLLEAAKCETDWLLIAFMSFNSLRVSELLECDVADVTFTPGTPTLHFVPNREAGRLPYVEIVPQVVPVLRRYLGVRRTGPLFTNRTGGRLSRHTVAHMVIATGRRAGIPARVTPQVLAYTLPALAIENGFSYGALLRARGVFQPRNAERWLRLATQVGGPNASPRLASLTLEPPDSTANLLLHVESALHDTRLPVAFAAMNAVALLERHLRELCGEVGVDVPAKGWKINRYLDELTRREVVDLADRRLIERLATYRNDAAHGWFERVPASAGSHVLHQVNQLVQKYPVRRIDQ